MQQVLSLPQTSVGKKVLMAVSGVVLLGYVVGHMLGNLKIFAGPEALNSYGAWLRTQPLLLWGARIAVAGSILVHLTAAVQLYLRNKSARKIGYKQRKDIAATYASRTMYATGPLILCFILYHLAHLTFHQGPYELRASNIYNNVVYGFQVPWIAAIYIVGNLALGLHLFHGLWAALGSLGLVHAKYQVLRRRLASAVVVGIVACNLSIPVSVMAGILKPTSQNFYFPELEE